jgi:uncharacterized protein YjbI with pentapeptide repeats
MERIDLSEACFAQTDLSQANLKDCLASGINLINAKAEATLFDGADLSNAHLEKAYLVGSSLMRSNLKNAHLHDTDISNCNLTDAILEGVHLVRTKGRQKQTILLPSQIKQTIKGHQYFISPSTTNHQITPLSPPFFLA